MSQARRNRESARKERRAREKRIRRIQRDTRKSSVRMTVVNGNYTPDDSDNPLSMAHELQQCNSALLYADEVTLVSARAALFKNAQQINEMDGVELLRVFRDVAPKFFPDAFDQLASTIAAIDSLPHRSQVPPNLRREFDGRIKELEKEIEKGMRPVRQLMQENVQGIFAASGYDQLQDAIDAGILLIEDLEGAVVGELTEDSDPTMVLGFLKKIDDVLTDGARYPLFDADASNLVRLGVEAGYFSPVPMARRLGADAAMADGLFDRLPNFQYATTREILDIKTELSASLSAFRQGVRSLTEDIEVVPEDPNFGHEVEDAWNQKVTPALEEIEQTIAENKSMSDLMKRTVEDSIGGAAVGGAITLPASLAVAAGPAGAYITAAGVFVGYSVATARALIKEYKELQSTKRAQFYFLFGTNERLGASGF